MSRPDVIRWVIDWMLTNDESISQDLALRCEREARREWGGQRIDYVAKTCEADRQARREAERNAHADLLGSQPMDEISRTRGISRATLYRLARRGPP